jgi:hypothetical protein
MIFWLTSCERGVLFGFNRFWMARLIPPYRVIVGFVIVGYVFWCLENGISRIGWVLASYVGISCI